MYKYLDTKYIKPCLLRDNQYRDPKIIETFENLTNKVTDDHFEFPAKYDPNQINSNFLPAGRRRVHEAQPHAVRRAQDGRQRGARPAGHGVRHGAGEV